MPAKLILKANQNKKIPQKHKTNAMHHWLKTLNKYDITTNGTIPKTGRWSGTTIMGQRATTKYGSFENDIKLPSGPTVTWLLGLL